jgi:hypothetical protein
MLISNIIDALTVPPLYSRSISEQTKSMFMEAEAQTKRFTVAGMNELPPISTVRVCMGSDLRSRSNRKVFF